MLSHTKSEGGRSPRYFDLTIATVISVKVCVANGIRAVNLQKANCVWEACGAWYLPAMRDFNLTGQRSLWVLSAKAQRRWLVEWYRVNRRRDKGKQKSILRQLERTSATPNNHRYGRESPTRKAAENVTRGGIRKIHEGGMIDAGLLPRRPLPFRFSALQSKSTFS